MKFIFWRKDSITVRHKKCLNCGEDLIIGYNWFDTSEQVCEECANEILWEEEDNDY